MVCTDGACTGFVLTSSIDDSCVEDTVCTKLIGPNDVIGFAIANMKKLFCFYFEIVYGSLKYLRAGFCCADFVRKEEELKEMGQTMMGEDFPQAGTWCDDCVGYDSESIPTVERCKAVMNAGR